MLEPITDIKLTPSNYNNIEELSHEGNEDVGEDENILSENETKSDKLSFLDKKLDLPTITNVADEKFKLLSFRLDKKSREMHDTIRYE